MDAAKLAGSSSPLRTTENFPKVKHLGEDSLVEECPFGTLLIRQTVDLNFVGPKFRSPVLFRSSITGPRLEVSI